MRPVLLAVLLCGVAAAAAGCFLAGGPRAEFTATPTTGYPPLEVAFDAGDSSSPAGAILFYKWDFGDGETGDNETVSHAYNTKGTYPVTLTVTDSSGGVGRVTHAVEALNHSPKASFKMTPNIVAPTIPATFDASASSDEDGMIEQWIWSFGDGATGEGEFAEHQFTAPGTVTVRLTVVDDDGASDWEEMSLHVLGGCCGR